MPKQTKKTKAKERKYLVAKKTLKNPVELALLRNDGVDAGIGRDSAKRLDRLLEKAKIKHAVVWDAPRFIIYVEYREYKRAVMLRITHNIPACLDSR